MKKGGQPFGQAIFRDWKGKFGGHYASSSEEPLLQVADLLAFCINRNTYLATKENRTATDQEFLRITSKMRINSDEIAPVFLRGDFTIEDFDKFLAMDRAHKCLE